MELATSNFALCKNNRLSAAILVLQNRNPAFQQACFESCKKNKLNAYGFPVDPDATIIQNRIAALKTVTTEYTTIVDDDDVLLMDLSPLVDYLDANPTYCGAFTDELWIDQFGKPIRHGLSTNLGQWAYTEHYRPHFPHHVRVMRTEWIYSVFHEFEKFEFAEVSVLNILLAELGPWHHVNQIGYGWRQHPGNTWRSRHVSDDFVKANEWAKARWLTLQEAMRKNHET